jgi:hypothetical protein
VKDPKKFDELRKLMKGMKLPAHRKMLATLSNVEWLVKNLGEYNNTHPNYQKAIQLAKNILELG